MATHTELVNQVLVSLSRRGDCRVWKNQTGQIGTIRYGLIGSSDILGLVTGGKILCLEIKVGRDKQSEQQKCFQTMIEKLGGVYQVVRSLDDAHSAVDRAIK